MGTADIIIDNVIIIHLGAPLYPCSLSPETGPCYALMPRYFHNSKTKRCEKFNYGGCYGNTNNFKTRESCEAACNGMSNMKDMDMCI